MMSTRSSPKEELPRITFPARLQPILANPMPPVTPLVHPKTPKSLELWGRATPIEPEPNLIFLRPLPPAIPYHQPQFQEKIREQKGFTFHQFESLDFLSVGIFINAIMLSTNSRATTKQSLPVPSTRPTSNPS
jgi:hypothetical protein